jgi:primosomal replication protein N''
MHTFSLALQQKLQPFMPFFRLTLQIDHPCFRLKKGNVVQFVQEIQHTGDTLSQQTDATYAQYYAQQIVQQIDLLQKAIKQQKKAEKVQNSPKTFQFSVRFPKNLHNLPPKKRLKEYQKALRLLNEKITWLITQAQSSEGDARAAYLAQLRETEYRKQKCVNAIDELESRHK